MTVLGSQWFASAGGAAEFDSTIIGNSIWLDGSADYLTKTWSGAGNRTRWTMSWWFRLNATGTEMVFFSANSGTSEFRIGMDTSTNTFLMVQDDNASMNVNTTALLRDVEWYHAIVSYDSNVAETSRVQVFINGVAMAMSTGSAAWPSSGGETYWNNNQANEIGRRSRTTSVYAKAYMAQVCFLDGDSIQNSDVAVSDFLDTFSFGDNGSQFIPKTNTDIASLATAAAGNSFCLGFDASADLGNDLGGENNDFTLSSIAAANQSVDTPSNSGCVWSAVNNKSRTLEVGNLRATGTTTDSFVMGTMGIPSSGAMSKVQWEIDVVDAGASYIGMARNGKRTGNTYSTSDMCWAFNTAGRMYANGSDVGLSYATSYTDGDRINIAVDNAAKMIWFGKDGTWTGGNPSTGAGGYNYSGQGTDIMFPMVGMSTGGACIQDATFAEADLTDALQSGFVTLESKNNTAPDYQGVDYFNTVLYAGNGTAIGSGGLAVTGVGFEPGFVWIKNRDQDDDHSVYDANRGVTKQIETNVTTGQTTEAEGLTAFGADGFTVGSLAQVNTSSENYVAWCANLSESKTSGWSGSPSITPSKEIYSPSLFMSAIAYTGNTVAGATIPHSLGAKPDCVIIKKVTTTVNNWIVYNTGLGATRAMKLNTTEGDADEGDVFWNDTEPTSTLISLGTNGAVNIAEAYIAYAFRNVPGVCQVGTYVGNYSADGIYLAAGFKPRWLLVKNASVSGQDWRIYDSIVRPYNENGQIFKANENSAQISTTGFDFLADGLKARDGNTGFNNTNTYSYVMIADIAGGATLPPIYGQ